MRKQNFVWLTLGILLTAGGCSIQYWPTAKAKQMGIPSCAKAVGGGLKISYEAPEDGVCYLADLTPTKIHRLLVTEEIEADSIFEFDVSDAHSETLETLGIEPYSKLVLYFAPKACLTGRNEQP